MMEWAGQATLKLDRKSV